MKYETIGGTVTQGEAYAKLLSLLRDAQDQALVLAHLHRANDSNDIRSSGWRGVGELLDRLCGQITKLATSGLQ